MSDTHGRRPQSLQDRRIDTIRFAASDAVCGRDVALLRRAAPTSASAAG